MKHPYLLLVSGPAGAGKSEFAELWASSRDHECARVSVDEVWDSIKSGRAHAVEGWSDEHARQHGITLDGATALASSFLSGGISVVVDDVLFPHWPDSGIEAWTRRLPGAELNMVLLMPSWQTIVQRNAEREGLDNLPEQMLRKIYDNMQGWREQSIWPIIDNGSLSVKETVSLAEKLLKTA